MKAKWSLMLVLTIVLSMFLVACGGGNNVTENEGDTGGNAVDTQEQQVLNMLESAELPTMDITQADDAASFLAMNQVFEGLYRLGKDNQPVPGMAESYDMEGNVITFKIRDDAVWSNGEPITAGDFVYSWKRALNPETISPYAYIMGPIKNASAITDDESELFGKVDELGVKAIDEKTLEVTLENPVPYFIGLTSFPTFYPLNQEFVEAQGKDYALQVDKMLFNGPFVMSDWTQGSGWTMKKNPDYWDKDTVKLDQINFKVVKDSQTETNLYEAGSTDRAVLSAELVDLYKDHPDFISYGEAVMWYLKFNVDRIPLEQRKAIQHAYNKKEFVDVILNNGSLAADYFVPAGFTFDPETNADFREKHGNIVSYDLDAAKKYWEEAGSPTVTYDLLINDREELKKTAEYLKNQLEQNLPGLTIKIKPVTFEQRLALDDAIDYDIQMSGWGPDYQDPMTFMDMWVSGGGNNNSNYADPEYDAVIQDAQTKLDDLGARFEKLQDLEVKLLEEDAVLAPLHQRGRAVLQKPYLKDFIVHPFGPDYSFKWTYIEGKE